jgi:hypothetical protein
VRKQDAFGRLSVTLSGASGKIARAVTRAPFNWVRVRSDGPWGEAKADRGAGAVFLLDRVSENEPPPAPRRDRPERSMAASPRWSGSGG